MKKYGEIISKLRKQHGLTQEQLGKKLNVSYQAVSKWENNLSEPDLETIEKIAEVFGISMSEFFDITKNDNKKINNVTIHKETNINNDKNFIKTKPWYLVAGLGVLIVVLSLFAFLIPVKYPSSKIYEMVDPSVFCITAEGSGIKQAGTGFFINDKGLAVTNYHVLENCTSGKIQLNNGKTYNISKIVGCDEDKDIAIIQIDIKKSKPVKIGNSNKISVGDVVYAIGYPESFVLGNADSTLTQGIISKTSYTIDGNTYIQTTADMTHGNSGGVLINEQGKVIGITSGQISDGNIDYMNLAIPINKIKDVKKDINKTLEDYYIYKNGTYTIVFDSNGGTGEMLNQEIPRMMSIALQKNEFVRIGYYFDGWSFNSKTYSDEQKVYNLTGKEEIIVLKAIWVIIDYNILYNLNGGINSEYNPSFYNYGNEIDLYSPSKKGYEFVGWYDNEDFNGEKIEKIDENSTGDIALYAKFNVIEYSLTYIVEDATHNNPTLYTIEDCSLILKDAVRQGDYQFTGWYLDENGTNQITEINCSELKDFVLYGKFLTTKVIDGFHVIETKYDIFTQLQNYENRDKNFILCNDIDMEWGEWTPVEYSGHFNGNGHTISKMIICNDIFITDIAFFESINDGKVENLNLENIKLFSATNAQTVYVGAIAGHVYNSQIKNCKVTNVEIEAYSGNNHHNWYQKIGGICGAISNSTIEECYASLEINYIVKYKDIKTYIGGLVGFGDAACEIVNSYSEGFINCGSSLLSGEGSACIGGIIGFAGQYSNRPDTSIFIENCYSTINLLLKENVFERCQFAGISAVSDYLNISASVNNCFYAGSIVNNGNVLTYDWISFCDTKNCFAFSGCCYTYIDDSTETKEFISNGSTMEDIWKYVSEKWDSSVWHLSTTANPTLKTKE